MASKKPTKKDLQAKVKELAAKVAELQKVEAKNADLSWRLSGVESKLQATLEKYQGVPDAYRMIKAVASRMERRKESTEYSICLTLALGELKGIPAVDLVENGFTLLRTFSVKYIAYNANKVGAIKLVREITGLGLKEAKEFVESGPKIVKSDLSYTKAKELLGCFFKTGCSAEVVETKA